MDVWKIFNGFGAILILLAVFYFSATYFAELSIEAKFIILLAISIIFLLAGFVLKGSDK